MRVLLFILFALIGLPLKGQSVFNYTYKEVCSGNVKSVNATVDTNGDTFTAFFFGDKRTFTLAEFQDGTYERWMNGVYNQWSQYYPCNELSIIVHDTSKKIAEQNDADISQPVIVMASDFSAYRSGDVSYGFGYSETNRLSGNGVGGVGSFTNSNVASFGLFRLTALNRTLNTVENFNIVFTKGNVVGSLMHGVYYKHRLVGLFAFNSIMFGLLNGFDFQYHTAVFGTSVKLYSTSDFNVNMILVNGYTYHVDAFKINYWFEDYLKVNPTLTVTYKLSPSFGIGASGTVNYRTDVKEVTDGGILIGGKLFF